MYTKEQLKRLFTSGGPTVDQCCAKLNAVMQNEACATLNVAPEKLQTSVALSKKCPDCLEPAQAFEWLFKRSHALKALTHAPPPNIYARDAFKNIDPETSAAMPFAPWFLLLMGTRVRNHYMNTYDEHHPTALFPRAAFKGFVTRSHNCCVKANARYPKAPDQQ